MNHARLQRYLQSRLDEVSFRSKLSNRDALFPGHISALAQWTNSFYPTLKHTLLNLKLLHGLRMPVCWEPRVATPLVLSVQPSTAVG